MQNPILSNFQRIWNCVCITLFFAQVFYFIFIFLRFSNPKTQRISFYTHMHVLVLLISYYIPYTLKFYKQTDFNPYKIYFISPCILNVIFNENCVLLNKKRFVLFFLWYFHGYPFATHWFKPSFRYKDIINCIVLSFLRFCPGHGYVFYHKYPHDRSSWPVWSIHIS